MGPYIVLSRLRGIFLNRLYVSGGPYSDKKEAANKAKSVGGILVKIIATYEKEE